MILYKIDKDKIKKLSSSKFSNEKELQTFIENNLEEIFEFSFIASEFGTQFSIDTIGFDTKTNSPVIIEFKEGQSFSVIDQGFTYLNYILTHKGDLQLKIDEKYGKNIKVDWSQIKIFFIAKNFNKFQIEATKFKGIPIQLVEYSLYENNIIGFDFIETYQEADLKAIMSTTKAIAKVGDEIKQYTIDDILNIIPAKLINIFKNLRDKVLEIDKSVIEAIGINRTIYKNNGLTFLYIDSLKKDIRCTLRSEHQKNTRGIFINREVQDKNVFKGRIKIKNENDIEEAYYFIKKAFESTE